MAANMPEQNMKFYSSNKLVLVLYLHLIFNTLDINSKEGQKWEAHRYT